MYRPSHIDPVRLDAEALVRLASKLRGIKGCGWGEPGVREWVAQLDWPWLDDAKGPTFRTGLSTGDATTRYISRSPVAGEPDGHHGIYVPVSHSEESVAAKVADFQWASSVLSGKFGKSSLLGSYGREIPFAGTSSSWGNPFRRWRGEPNSLELRGTEFGVELILCSTAMIEDWQHARSSNLEGFFGSRRAPDNVGLLVIGTQVNETWASFQESLERFLTPLAAELNALEVTPSIAISGGNPSGDDVYIEIQLREGKLQLGAEVDDRRPDETSRLSDIFTKLGWLPVENPPGSLEHPYEAFTTAGFAPGEVDGSKLSRLIVDTLLAIGVPSVGRPTLFLADFSPYLGDPELGYYTEWHGLNLHRQE